jgi:hypothetical protein
MPLELASDPLVAAIAIPIISIIDPSGALAMTKKKGRIDRESWIRIHDNRGRVSRDFGFTIAQRRFWGFLSVRTHPEVNMVALTVLPILIALQAIIFHDEVFA